MNPLLAQDVERAELLLSDLLLCYEVFNLFHEFTLIFDYDSHSIAYRLTHFATMLFYELLNFVSPTLVLPHSTWLLSFCFTEQQELLAFKSGCCHVLVFQFSGLFASFLAIGLELFYFCWGLWGLIRWTWQFPLSTRSPWLRFRLNLAIFLRWWVIVLIIIRGPCDTWALFRDIHDILLERGIAIPAKFNY